MTPVDVCNLALLEIGQRVQINSLTDNSPQANACSLFYSPKIRMLLRSANWAFARAQMPLTLWKSVVINGVYSPTPPPQPWQYSYLYPADCEKMRFTQPTLPTPNSTTPPLTSAPNNFFCYPPTPTAIPFVEATDLDANNSPIRVILSNMPQAQGIYVRDLSQVPDAWDSLFLSAATALLASYLINALARDKAQFSQQIGQVKSILDQARSQDANEAISNIDHTPDWLRARRLTSLPWLWTLNYTGGALPYGGWEACQFPDGQFF